MKDFSLFVYGMPATGKTTFLAALYSALSDNSSDSSLKLARLGEDGKYLNEIVRAWLDCEQVSRTVEERAVDLRVNFESQELDLMFPDLSGESFRTDIWKHRKLSAKIKGMIQNASGLLMFVNPTTISEPQFIEDMAGAVQKLKHTTSDESIAEAPQPPKDFELEKVCTQVKYVDFLQTYSELNQGAVLRVVVILSAWDEVRKTSGAVEPRLFLSQRLPLLYQYLESNTGLIWNCYGISAQGGDFESEKDKIQKVPTEKRVQVFKASERENPSSHDIAEPIVWMMNSKK